MAVFDVRSYTRSHFRRANWSQISINVTIKTFYGPRNCGNYDKSFDWFPVAFMLRCYELLSVGVCWLRKPITIFDESKRVFHDNQRVFRKTNTVSSFFDSLAHVICMKTTSQLARSFVLITILIYNSTGISRLPSALKVASSKKKYFFTGI